MEGEEEVAVVPRELRMEVEDEVEDVSRDHVVVLLIERAARDQAVEAFMTKVFLSIPQVFLLPVCFLVIS